MKIVRIIVSLMMIFILEGTTGCSKDQSNTIPQTNTSSTAIAPQASWSPGPAGLIVPKGPDGPTESQPVPHGFSHTPQGAVLAAITAQSWMAGADDQVWPQVAEYLLEPGIGRDQWAQSRGLVTVKGTVDKPARFVAFKFSEYSNEKAVVVLATQWPDGMLTAYPVQLSATSGQWRVVIPPQKQAPDMEEIKQEHLADFVAFNSSEEPKG